MGVIKNFYNRVTNGLVYLQTPLKAYELSDEILLNKYRILSKEMDVNNVADLGIWVDIINNSYDDCVYTEESAKELLTNHPYLENIKTFLFKEVVGGDIGGLYR